MSDAKAQELVLEAQKKLKGGWTNFFGGGTSRIEDASDLFAKAANVYKMNKKWQEAGDAFVQAGDCQAKLDSKHEAATHYVSAATCYRKVDPKAAIEQLRRAVEIFTDLGRFNIAAKHEKDIAEIYESDLVDLEGAIAAYQQAADWYSGEESKSSANNCLLKVALFSAQLEKYDRAIEIYEQIAAASVDNSLLRWSVKEYFFRAGVCHLAKGDAVGAIRAIENYQQQDATFSSTRECTFLKNIASAFESNDVETFTNHVVEYDNFSKLDNWKTTMLLRIKRGMREESLT